MNLNTAKLDKLPVGELDGCVQAWFLKRQSIKNWVCSFITPNELEWLIHHRNFLSSATRQMLTDAVSRCTSLENRSKTCSFQCLALRTWDINDFNIFWGLPGRDQSNEHEGATVDN